MKEGIVERGTVDVVVTERSVVKLELIEVGTIGVTSSIHEVNDSVSSYISS